MAEPSPSLENLEELANRLASEIVFAKSGSDEGLIPAFALLNDIVEAAEGEPALAEPAKQACERIESYLDAASGFDDELLGYMRELVTWMPEWIQARRTGGELPSRPGKVQPSAEVERPETEADPAFLAAASAKPTPEGESPAEPASPSMPSAPEEILVLNLEENRELLTEFHAEAVDHIDQIEAALLALDDNPEDTDGINSLFRSFHTLKGNAGFLQLMPMQRLCHEVETLLDLARSDQLCLNPTIITAILSSRDAVQTMLDQVFDGLQNNLEPTSPVLVNALVTEVARLAAGGQEEAPAPERPVPFDPQPEVKAVADPSGATTPKAVPASEAQREDAEAQSNVDSPKAVTRQASTVRVNTEKLDQLMDVVGELVIVQGQILASAGNTNGTENSVLERNINQLTRITKDLQHTAMALRMVPIKPTFQKMERMVRDLAHRMGRKVAMEVIGEGTEVDRTVVEEIADPLVHMIRNALDHGIEPEAERLANGKAPVGRLSLRAYHQGGNIIIELEDDGRGINAEKVLRKAREKGIVEPNQTLTESEILVLIFAPGFSTAAEITEVSGRGVGMDVVRRNIDKLRGSIEVHTERGKGSIFRIRLPLTMAIIDGLVLRVGNDQFVLPTTAVKIALRPTVKDLVRIQGKGEVLDHRGKLLPLVRLHERFQVEGAETDPTRGMVVLIEHSGRTSALLVDEMVKKQEVVIKNLGGFFGSVSGIAGGAILGDGNIALILDPPALVSAA